MAYALAVDVKTLDVDRAPALEDAAAPGAADPQSAHEGDRDQVASPLFDE